MTRKYIICASFLLVHSFSYAGFKEGHYAYLDHDYKLAIQELEPLAKRGNAEAQYLLAGIYDKGLESQGVKVDKAKALAFYTKSALQGYQSAQLQMWAQEDFPITEITILAESGNKHAQAMLGDHIYISEKSIEGEVKALSWYRKAAEQGSEFGQFGLGKMYETGRGGLEPSDEEAANWYLKAVEKKFNSQNEHLNQCLEIGGVPGTILGSHLAKMLEKNPDVQGVWFDSIEGVSCLALAYMSQKNINEAEKWNIKLAEMGNIEDKLGLSRLYDGGYYWKKSIDKSIYWLEEAAKQGSVDAALKLAEMYIDGQKIPQDFNKGIEWYKHAKNQGSAIALYRLAKAYEAAEESDAGSYVSKENVWSLYEQAAQKGISSAQFTLGYRYKTGEGVVQNYSQAAEWYRKAATQGNIYALNNLAIMYEVGQGVSKNLILAHILYNLAAARNVEDAAENRQRVAKFLTSSQLLEAQNLAAKWKENTPLPVVTSGTDKRK